MRGRETVEAGDVVVGAFPGAQVTKTRPAVVLSTEEHHRHKRLFPVTLSQRVVRVIGRLSDADWKSVRECFRAGFGGE
jgi:mRNA-degrading endonuclease toxin of MazEF toxin-antitoxin module